MGDILFTFVNLARHLNLHSEDMLRKTNKKFIKRFKQIEKTLKAKGKTVENSSLDEMNEIWDKVKK